MRAERLTLSMTQHGASHYVVVDHADPVHGPNWIGPATDVIQAEQLMMSLLSLLKTLPGIEAERKPIRLVDWMDDY